MEMVFLDGLSDSTVTASPVWPHYRGLCRKGGCESVQKQQTDEKPCQAYALHAGAK